MTFDEQIEILQAAKEGREIEFLYIKPNTWRTKDVQSTPGFNFQERTYRIKKKTKKVYLFVMKSSNDYLLQTILYFENEKQAQERYPGWTVLKRLDNTEIEIDE